MNDDPFNRIGRGMFLVVWILFFLGVFLFFYYHEQSESRVYFVKRGEIILAADKEGHYRIKGAINGNPSEFLIDTGATIVAIPQSLADRWHISGRYPITISTANGEVTGSLTRLLELSFGEFIFHDVKAVIIPGSNDDTVLLGMNVLSQFNIIQQDKKLVLKRQ